MEPIQHNPKWWFDYTERTRPPKNLPENTKEHCGGDPLVCGLYDRCPVCAVPVKEIPVG